MIAVIKRRLEHYRLYSMAQEMKWRIESYSSVQERQRFRVVSLEPKGPIRGNVLLSRINRAFLLKAGEPIPTTHQNVWEAYQMALILLDLGFAVDVIDFENNSFLPKKDYSIFIDARLNMERIAPFLNRDCVKVFHAVTAHPLFHNAAEMERLLALQQRRGITLLPRRLDPLNWGIENADCATVLGNEFTLSTYRYANKPLFPILPASAVTYAWPKEKDSERARNHFLFLAGEGMVHKGLDLVLEAFAAMPQYSLTVCGPVEKEKDFVQAYRRELYETDNIRLAGWVDVSGDKFLQIARNSVALIHPSCSEGCSTAVVLGMHAGLIPIISYESSVDVTPDFGIILRRSSIEEIREAVRSIASLPVCRLREMAQNAWAEARKRYSCEDFVEEYKRAISQMLALTGNDSILNDQGVLSR